MAKKKDIDPLSELAMESSQKEGQSFIPKHSLGLQLKQDLFIRSAYYNKLGLIAHTRGDYPTALHYFNRALLIVEKTGDLKTQVVYLNNIGGIYKLQGNNQKAIKIFESILQIANQLGNSMVKATYLNRIGLVYHDQGTALKTKENYKEALTHYKEAMTYYKGALHVSGSLDDLKMKSTCLNNIAGIYNAQGNYSKALIQYKKALHILIKLGLESSPNAEKIKKNITCIKLIMNKRSAPEIKL